MLIASRTRLIALLGGLIAATTGLSRQPQPAPPPEPAGPRRVDADGFPLPPGAVARYGSTRFRATSGIESLFFSSDGKYIIGGTDTDTCTLHVWDIATGRLVNTIENAQPLRVMGRDVVFAAQNGRQRVLLKRLALPSGTQRQLTVLAAWLSNEISLSPSGAKAVYWRLGRNATPLTVVAETTTGRELWHTDDYDWATAQFTADEKQIAWPVEADPPGRITFKVFDAATGNPAGEFTCGLTGTVAAYRFSPEGKWLVSTVGRTRSFVVWDAATRKVAFTAEAKDAVGIGGDGVRWIGFPASDVAVLFGDSGAEVWDLNDRKQLLFFQMPCSEISAVAVSTNGRRAAVAHAGRVAVYDLTTGKLLPASATPTGVQQLLGFTPQGSVRFDLEHVGENSVRRVEWEPRTGRTTSSPAPREAPAGACWSADKSRYLTVEDNVVTLYDALSGRRLSAFPVSGRVWRTEVTGKRVFVWGDNELFVWGAEGRLRATIPIGPVQGIGEFDPREYDLLPSGDAVLVLRHGSGPKRDSTEVSAWDADTGRNLGRSLIPSSWVRPRLAPDGRRVVLSAPVRRGVWWRPPPAMFDIATGRKLVQFVKYMSGSEPFSPDARMLAGVQEENGDLELIEVATGQERVRFRPVGGIDSVHFSADGRWLATTSNLDMILVWDVRGEFDRPKQPPDAAALEAAWAALAADDAKVAFAAIRLLAAVPDRAVPFLKQKPTPVVASDPKQLRALVADLDNPAFAERERAAAELTRSGAGAERALREAVRSHPSAEVRRRAADLLDRIAAGKLTPDEVRAVRVVEAVEWMGTPDAMKLLEGWAGGAAGSRLTEEAKTALSRIGRR
jgi:WD40 repeat protein